MFARHLSRIKTTHFATRTLTQLSYVKGVDIPPLSNETLPSFYKKELLIRFAARPALISRHEPVGDSGYLRWSYEQLWKEATNDLARGLLGLGATEGTRVGVVMGNNRYVVRGRGDSSAEIFHFVIARPSNLNGVAGLSGQSSSPLTPPTRFTN